MATTVYIFNGISTSIQCSKNQKMKEICDKFCSKINTNINSLVFLYGGNKLDLDKKYEDYTKENKITILVYKNENEVCPKCGKLIDSKKIDNLILSNNNINSTLIGIKNQIDNIMNDINNNKKINEINNQLRNINIIINHIIEDIKSNIINNLNEIKNEIICIYDKKEDEINLLHDYNLDTSDWGDEYIKAYAEGKNNVNEKNIEIYINDKKIKFNNKYKSNEIGDIKVIFKFNKFLTNTSYMFRDCSSLKSIDLSSFNTTNVKDMSYMFSDCSSLLSIDLSSFNTTNIKKMYWMSTGCFSLKKEKIKVYDKNILEAFELRDAC